MYKSIALLVMMLAGMFFPQAHNLSFLVSYCLIFVLFFAFLEEKLTLNIFLQKRVYFVLCANVAIAFIAYALVKPFQPTLAFILFLVGMTPTGVSCPGVISLGKGNVGYAVATVLVTNIFMAIVGPFFLTALSHTNIQVGTILFSTAQIILIPLIIAQIIQRFFPVVQKQLLQKGKFLVFYVWIFSIFLAMARASDFIINHHAQMEGISLFLIIACVATICVVNFVVGRLIGGKKYALEFSQGLGQKNTLFTTWIALEFFSPLIAIGPISYVVFHNLYNAFVMYRLRHK